MRVVCRRIVSSGGLSCGGLSRRGIATGAAAFGATLRFGDGWLGRRQQAELVSREVQLFALSLYAVPQRRGGLGQHLVRVGVRVGVRVRVGPWGWGWG